jgi:hypothetical protein
VDADGNLLDMSGWTIHFVAAGLTKTATVSGTFNSDPAINTQVATVTLTAAETVDLQATTYPYSWKRVDSGYNDVLVYGSWPVQQTTQ